MIGSLVATNINYLLPTGVRVEYVYIFIGIIIIYLMVHPFVNWVVSMQSTILLTYVMSSLAFLVLFLLGIILTTVLNLTLFAMTLQCLAIFGGCLIIIHTLQHIFRKNKSI
ncbi:hypothetical protein SAMN05216232_2941 [Virgibacillus subterraneus]|uniref:Uncharacterized protein n=2 Tax=Virgibacillus TaxID=84406 RepID=A0A1H1CM95_9BACI|nr:hypothetical protein SAMN05216231_2312 [Virgibacillus salinus]SEQ63535.1 hypothetical protein SAMN05216232_2941 [Virgibacillus subterraneus]